MVTKILLLIIYVLPNDVMTDLARRWWNNKFKPNLQIQQMSVTNYTSSIYYFVQF